MKRNDRYRTLSTIQRYGTDLEEITLVYDEQTRTLAAGMSRAEADITEAAKAILEFLGNQTEPLEERAIQEGIEGRKGTKSKALRRLRDAHEIEWTGTGKRGDPYLYKKAGFSPPIYMRGEKYQNSESDLTDTNDKADAGSRVFADFEQDVKTRGEHFSDENQAEIGTDSSRKRWPYGTE
jgi:hypothetical protein